MQIRCLVCDALLAEVEEPSRGQITHCKTTIRWALSIKDDNFVLKTWEHSAEAYNPLHIWTNPALSMVEKEVKLGELCRCLRELEYQSRITLVVNLKKAQKLRQEAAETLLNAIIVDSIKVPEKTYDGVTVHWEEKGKVNKLWIQMLMMWAKVNTEMKATDIERNFRDITTAVRFARRYGIEVPPGLENIR